VAVKCCLQLCNNDVEAAVRMLASPFIRALYFENGVASTSPDAAAGAAPILVQLPDHGNSPKRARRTSTPPHTHVSAVSAAGVTSLFVPVGDSADGGASAAATAAADDDENVGGTASSPAVVAAAASSGVLSAGAGTAVVSATAATMAPAPTPPHLGSGTGSTGTNATVGARASSSRRASSGAGGGSAGCLDGTAATQVAVPHVPSTSPVTVTTEPPSVSTEQGARAWLSSIAARRAREPHNGRVGGGGSKPGDALRRSSSARLLQQMRERVSHVRGYLVPTMEQHGGNEEVEGGGGSDQQPVPLTDASGQAMPSSRLSPIAVPLPARGKLPSPCHGAGAGPAMSVLPPSQVGAGESSTAGHMDGCAAVVSTHTTLSMGCRACGHGHASGSQNMVHPAEHRCTHPPDPDNTAALETIAPHVHHLGPGHCSKCHNLAAAMTPLQVAPRSVRAPTQSSSIDVPSRVPPPSQRTKPTQPGKPDPQDISKVRAW